MDTAFVISGILSAAAPLNLLYGFAGVLLGTLVGVRRSRSCGSDRFAVAAGADAAAPYLIMLFGITTAQYGGSTYRLVNIPARPPR
jgi:TctA family transporter